MPDRVFKRNDTHNVPRTRLLDEYGAAIDLTGLTVRYSLRDTRLGTLKINRATATIVNQATNRGEVYYQFTSGNVDMAGIFSEEWEVTYGDGTKETFPTDSWQLVRIVADEDAT